MDTRNCGVRRIPFGRLGGASWDAERDGVELDIVGCTVSWVDVDIESREIGCGSAMLGGESEGRLSCDRKKKWIVEQYYIE